MTVTADGAPVSRIRARARRTAHVLRFVLKATAVNIRGRMEYPGDFAFEVVFGILWQTSTLAFAAVLLTRFDGLGNFPAGGVLLIVGMRLMAHGLFTMVFGNLSDALLELVEEGRIEGFFLRPLSVLTQILISRFNINALGDFTVGVTVCAMAVSQAPVDWTAAAVLYLVAAIIGGVFLEAAVQLPLAALLLRSPFAHGVGKWLDDIMATIGNYPLSILPLFLRGVFTFVLPLAFVAYFPVLVLLDRTPENGLLSWLAPWSPAVCLLLFLISKRLWNWNLRHYRSTGG
ncbi:MULTISPECIES: ABC-2 family transporter protein [unclassified Streptomyces]|uniref:ABC transporter permease n=1 Tax=unclassified Streptomyces TaxID=2593676 RepID=UPI002E34577F|nr:ABC-2 family transporter protein [Streptomyces sp. NBC_00683]